MNFSPWTESECAFQPVSAFPSGRRHRLSSRVRVTVDDHIWTWAYAMPAAAVVSASLRINGMQFLTIRRYLMLMFSALIVLLVVAAVWF